MTKVTDIKERVIYYIPEGLIVENITPRNVLINQNEVEVDNILGGEIFLDNHPLRKSITVKPVLSSHSKIDKTMVFKTNDSLMKVERIAECSLCNNFDLH